MTRTDDSTVTLCDLRPEREQFLDDVIRGLSGRPKTLSCKYFYDEEGSRLFDRICDLPEYYLTRTELAIMRERAGEMAAELGPRCLIIEPGAGSGTKIRLLLDELEDPAGFVPIDISGEHLQRSAEELSASYPDLEIVPVSADFTSDLVLPAEIDQSARRIMYFPGSTIGNFERVEAVRLLRQMAAVCGPEGGLLIGVDLKKDPAVLELAYNDGSGVTAAFNLNVLARINRELGGDFDLDAFEHRAVYNPDPGRVEIYLVSRARQIVTVDGRRFLFDRGEAICTEHSHKYSLDDFRALAANARWQVRHVWTDPQNLFSVQYLTSA